MEKQKKKLRIGLQKWDLEIYEIGNTYHISTKSPTKKKDVHLLMSKHSYFHIMINLEKRLPIHRDHGITSYSKEFISKGEFEKLRKVLIEAIELDISIDEKKLHGIYSSYEDYYQKNRLRFVKNFFNLFKKAA